MLVISLWEVLLMIALLMQLPAILRFIGQSARFTRNQMTLFLIYAKTSFLVWFGVMVILQVMLFTACGYGNFWWSGILFLVTAVWIYILHAVMGKIANMLSSLNTIMSQAVQNTDILNVGKPYLTKLSILVSLLSGVFVFCFPNSFYGWWGMFIIIFAMFGMAWGLVFHSENPIAPYVLMGIMVIILLSKVAWVLAPNEMEKAMIWRYKQQQTIGMENLNENQRLRKDGQIRTVAAKCWQIDTYPNGDPIKNEDGIIVPKPSKIIIHHKVQQDGKDVYVDEEMSSIPAYTYVKVLDKRVITLDAGEQLIQVFVQNSDGTWIMGDDKRTCWIAASLMAFLPVKSDIADIAKPTIIPEIWTNAETIKVVLAANEMAGTTVNVIAGQTIRVRATGLVNAVSENNKDDPSYKWIGPDGWGVENAFSENKSGPLSNGESFMALSTRISKGPPSISDGKWTKVGTEKVWEAKESGTLYFTVNDKLSVSKSNRVTTNWFGDNQGGFQLEVQVK